MNALLFALSLVSPAQAQGWVVPGSTQTAVAVSTYNLANVGTIVLKSTTSTGTHKIFEVKTSTGYSLFSVQVDGSVNISSVNIQAGSINTAAIGSGAVTINKILAGAVDTNALGSGAVTVNKIKATGVTAGAYGDGGNIPQITVNAQGQVTLLGTTPNTGPSGAGNWTASGSNIYYNAGAVTIGDTLNFLAGVGLHVASVPVIMDGSGGGLKVGDGLNNLTSTFRQGITNSTWTFNSRTKFEIKYSSQVTINNYCAYDGLQDDDGELILGNGTNNSMGRIGFCVNKRNELYIENTQDCLGCNVAIRTRVNGTQIEGVTVKGTGRTAIMSGTTALYYCNGGASIGNICRGNGCSCVGGSWVDLTIDIP